MASLADTFDRANSTTTLGSTSTGNVPWSALRGTWGISSNRAYTAVPNNSATDYAVVETGAANGTLAVTIATASASTGVQFGVVFRATDLNNMLIVQTSGNDLKLFKVIAGTTTQFGTVASQRPVAGDVLSVEFTGTSIVVKRNGSTVMSVTESAHQTATKVGLNNFQNAATFESMSFVDPAAAPGTITGTLNAVLPKLTASLTGTYVVGTDVSNRDWARRRGGIGLVTVEVPVEPVPPTRTRAPRVTKAVPLPTPTMVDGRPT